MLTYAYFAVLAAACLVALTDWRKGVYAAILLDFVRDPVRKLDPSESVLITVSVLALWGVIFVSVWGTSQAEIKSYFRANPLLVKAFRYLVMATIPGSVIALVAYAGGYRMVALGLVSYLAPCAGVAMGIAFAKHPEQVHRLLGWYCVVNGVALIGVVAEYREWGLPALGGLKDMVWVRYSGTETVKLVGGFYRSPDIMGLHAAQVAMFAMILAMRKPDRVSFGWFLVAAFSGLCLVLSGRRKMLGMPIVFVTVFGLFSYLRGMRNSRFAIVPILCVIGLGGGIYAGLTDEYVADEYTNYAGTIFTEGAARSREVVFESALGTVMQTGIVGTGIGSATQGNYHVVGGAKMGWQEDAIGRVFRELGLPGAILLLLAGIALIQSIVVSVRQVDPRGPLAAFQLMLLALVVANFCSFLISHQQFSGDPPSAIIVLLVLGVAFSVPVMQQSAAARHRRNVNAPELGSGPIAQDREGVRRNSVSKNPLAQLHRRQ